jgi:integrase
VLSFILALAVRDGRLSRNPADGVKLPRASTSSKRFLTHQQVADLAGACGPKGLAVQVMAYCGLRYGELVALRVSRVDLMRRRLEITESVTEVAGKAVHGTPKRHQCRSVPIPRGIADDLAVLLAGKAAETWCSLPPHTAASLAVSAGANVKSVQRMLGHASAAMTLDVYSGLFDDDLDAVAELLDKAAAPPVRPESNVTPITLREKGR